MKITARSFLTAVLILVFLFSTAMFLYQQQSKSIAGDIYADALALAFSSKTDAVQDIRPPEEQALPVSEPRWVAAPLEEEDPCVQMLEELDLESLQAVNSDVVGWIMIPDTKINYPLLQGSDNDYYLKHTWDHKRHAVGAIFLDYLSNPGLTDFHTVVYGHNMNNGSMFAGIRQYQTQAYWEAHPYVYIRNDQGVFRYEIFSSYLADVEGYTYCIQFSDETARKSFLSSAIQDSVIQTGIVPESTDRILTLSTCSGRGYSTRWVLQARLKMVPEKG